MISNLFPNNITGVPYDAWNLMAGATKMAAVATNDADTTYIRTAVTARQCFNVAWPGGISVVASLTAKGYFRNTNAGFAWTVSVGCRNATGESASGAALAGTAYTIITHVCARPGGGGWTAADCQNGITWVQCYGETPGGAQANCTQLWFALDFTPAAGGFAFLISSVIGPLVAGTIALAQMARLRLEFNRAAFARGLRTRLTPADDKLAWDDLRDHRFPAWSFA